MTDAVDEEEDESRVSWLKWAVIAAGIVVALVVGASMTAVVALGALAASGAEEVKKACEEGRDPLAGTGGSWGVNPVASAPPAVTTLDVQVDGKTVTLNERQLTIARAIIQSGSDRAIPQSGIKVALMTALQESTLRMLANDSVDESLSYPNDGIGSDHDSVNPFQQRPSSGWGTVKELMDLSYSIAAFYGGPAGPNAGSPKGLLDIDGWESMSLGEAAQSVQVSAYPDHYAKWEQASTTIIQALGVGAPGAAALCGEVGVGPGPGTGQVQGTMALPLKSDYNMTSGYGPRDIDVSGASSWHAAIDLQRWPDPCGDPVYAILPGEVTLSSSLWLSITHPDGFVVSYLHMFKSDRVVDVGDQVKAGDQIGAVGNVAPSSGCHLDLRINVAGNTNPAVAQLPRSQTLGATDYNVDFVDPEAFMRLWGVDVCPAATCTRPE